MQHQLCCFCRFYERVLSISLHECIQQYDYNRDEHNIISGISHKREREREREIDPINNLNSSSCNNKPIKK